jgi:hypothetical protein
VLRAQVDDGPQAQVEEQVQVLTVEPVQRVGPVQRPPAHPAAVGGRVATEVTEVEAGVEANQALGERRHACQATDVRDRGTWGT